MSHKDLLNVTVARRSSGASARAAVAEAAVVARGAGDRRGGRRGGGGGRVRPHGRRREIPGGERIVVRAPRLTVAYSCDGNEEEGRDCSLHDTLILIMVHRVKGGTLYTTRHWCAQVGEDAGDILAAHVTMIRRRMSPLRGEDGDTGHTLAAHSGRDDSLRSTRRVAIAHAPCAHRRDECIHYITLYYIIVHYITRTARTSPAQVHCITRYAPRAHRGHSGEQRGGGGRAVRREPGPDRRRRVELVERRTWWLLLSDKERHSLSSFHTSYNLSRASSSAAAASSGGGDGCAPVGDDATASAPPPSVEATIASGTKHAAAKRCLARRPPPHARRQRACIVLRATSRSRQPSGEWPSSASSSRESRCAFSKATRGR